MGIQPVPLAKYMTHVITSLGVSLGGFDNGTNGSTWSDSSNAVLLDPFVPYCDRAPGDW